MSSDEETPTRVVIGIAFGNSYSSIASTIGGDAKVIANEEGDRQIPSILSYVDGEEFHGTQAKAQLVRNPKNTVAFFRDLLGKDFDAIDPTPCHNSAHPTKDQSAVGFSIKDTADDTPNFVNVSEVTTRHLKRLKDSASDYLGKKVNAAVLSVPTDFTEAQKLALSAAGDKAGLEILQYISEPTAALLAADRRLEEKPQDRISIVADLGGTRSDVAVISTKGGMYSILATSHDYGLGGAKLDEVLMDYIAKEFIKKHKADPRNDPRGLAKLRLESEAIKKALSLGNSAAFSVESLTEGIDYSQTVNRSRFELLAGKVFSSFTRLIEATVEKADLDHLDIDEILLSGGTSHIPRIAQNLQSSFPESTRITAPATDTAAVNPSELVARGAALQAVLVESYDKEDIEQSTHPMVTVTPHLARAIGLATKSSSGADVFTPLILAETPLPVRRTTTFPSGSSSDVLLRLCEGIRDIKVTAAEAKPKVNGKPADDDDDDDEEDSDNEEEDVRESVWKVGTVLGELAVKDTKKDSKLTVQINIGVDLEVSISAMEVGGGKPGVRGVIPAPPVTQNGAAH